MTEASSGHLPLDRGQLQQRAIRGALWTGFHTVVSLPIAFVVNILLARVLGVEGYGRLAYLTTVIGIAGVIAGMGVTTALIQFGAKAHAAGRIGEVRSYLSGAQGFRLLVSGPLVALAVVGFVRVEIWLLVVALLFGVGAPALFGNARPALTIENRTDRVAQLTMIGNIVMQAAVVVAVLTIGTADSVWSARVIASGVLLALPLISISRHYRLAVLRPRGPWTLPRGFWRFAVPTGVAGTIGALSANRIEVVLLDWFADPVAMGLFGLAFGLAGHVYAPAQALIGPLLPAVSGLVEVDRPAARRAFLRTSRVSSAIGGLMVAAAVPALAVLVPVLYGLDFAPARDHVVALGIASAVTLVGSPHHAFLMARLGGRRLLWISVVKLSISLSLALALIPLIGVWGATIGCAAAMLFPTILVSVGEARALDVSLGELSRNVGGILVGMIVAGLVWGVARSLDMSPVPIALAASLSGVLLFLVGVRVTKGGMSHDDVGAIASGLPGRLRTLARRILGLAAHDQDGRTPPNPNPEPLDRRGDDTGGATPCGGESER